MEFFRRTSSSVSALGLETGSSTRASAKRSRMRTPFSYRLCDGITEGLLYFMVVATPWFFGTTQTWSIWTMNLAGYFLGILLCAKWIVRWTTGFRPSRWGDAPANDFFDLGKGERDASWHLTRSLAVLTIFILLYCFISALNARATYIHEQRLFEYHDSIGWLPQSYDSRSTWFHFWMYLGLACSFWAARDWLLGKTSSERKEVPRSGRRSRHDEEQEEEHEIPVLPARLRRLLWVICLNGAALGLVSILQRLSGTNKLLWLVEPRMNRTADAQFGPYAYRANAAQYFNLIWPVCLGFWMTLRQSARRSRHAFTRLGSGNHMMLLPGAVLMAGCPIISTTRGGAFIAVALILLAIPLTLIANRKDNWKNRAATLLLFVVILGFAGHLGWEQLEKRFETLFTDNMSNRTEIYENSLPIARDFPVYGTGPGTFTAMYQLYRQPDHSWAGYLHDDWLETRIHFGWVGFTAILLMLGMTLGRWFGSGGIPVAWPLAAMIWTAMLGVLAHAKYDFPFQVYSILFLFLILCAILFSISRKT
jgi:hypothetical protein